MNYKTLYLEEEFTIVIINWSRPFSLDYLKDKPIANHEQGYFYKILGKRNEKYDLFYIGQTQSQYISGRLFNKDHLIKQASFKKSHPKHRLYVSVGCVEEPQRIKEKLVDNVESLLIFGCSNPDFKRIKNKKNSLTHKVIRNYRIINKGFKQDGMYREIAFGLFYK